MNSPLNRLTIRGFTSIERLEAFELRNLNVLIGANGAGKSNFVEFFRMLRAIADTALQRYVNERGADGLFFLGPKRTPEITAKLEFGNCSYEFGLRPSAQGVFLGFERGAVQDAVRGRTSWVDIGGPESKLGFFQHLPPQARWEAVPNPEVLDALSRLTVYHFHDTGMLAPMRREHLARDRDRLRHDASNIAAFLMHLRDTNAGAYRLIRDTVRLIAPFFDDFLLRPETRGGNDMVRLEWLQKGAGDFPFQPNHLSDGTIRFICLATALFQPKGPATLLIDEPELGLHPYAIAVLADLVRSAAERTQVIVSTQSPTLLDHFDPEHIVVVNRRDGRSTFERLDPDRLKDWLADYSVGELWQKNVIRGGPTNE